ALTRNRREKASLFEHGRAQCKEREAAPDEQHQDTQDKDAARRVDGKGMHRREYARAHKEGADQREREGQYREQDRPYLERIAFLHHERGVKKRRGGEPGHERRILYGIPEPPAAPAERVIGPMGAQRDAER